MDHPKTAVITGAGSGIGRALALALAARGYKVGLVDVDQPAALETLEMISRSGGSGEAYCCDVTDCAAVQAMADHFFDTWGEVGLLFNNAGIGAGGYIGETCLEDWEKVMRTNFFGVVYGCQAFVGRMKAQGAGHIVNTASMAGLFAIPGFAPYNSSKSAVVALTETLRVELAPHNIGASVLCPSMIATNIIDNSLKVVNAGGYEDSSWGFELINTGMAQTKVGAADVARMVLDAVDKDRLFIVTRLSARLAWLHARLSPELYYRMVSYLHKKGLARGIFMWLARKGLA